MFDNIENLKLLDIVRGASKLQRTFKNRFSHAFVFKISGESIYSFEGETLSLKQGEMLFTPKGSTYDVKRISAESEYILINFDAAVNEAVPQVHSMNGYSDINYIYEHLIKLWIFGSKSEKYECYSVFYNVLAFVLKKEKMEYSYIKKLGKIESAVNYMRSNIFNCDLRVDDLHLLCGVSDTYFRKIFKANFGVTPQEYIINKRLSHARSIIITGDYDSIGAVALSVGYSDALYFSRIFSKKYGTCPSEYVRELEQSFYSSSNPTGQWSEPKISV